MVDARLAGIRETAAGSKTTLDGHVSSIEGITSDAKRKWQEFSLQAENDTKENADFSAAKHCRFELLLQRWYTSNPRTCFIISVLTRRPYLSLQLLFSVSILLKWH